MTSKIEQLMDAGELGLEANNAEFEIILVQDELVTMIAFEYDNYTEVYLSLYDFDEPPYRDIVAYGKGHDLEKAKAAAIHELNHILYSTIH